MTKYSNLERACGGMITPETLEIVRLAIPEFHAFMEDARAFFAPRKEKADPRAGTHSREMNGERE